MDLSLSSAIHTNYSGSNNGCNCYASVNQGSQSISGNTTTINYSMSAVYYCSPGYTWGGASRYNNGYFDLLIDGKTVATINLNTINGWGNGTTIGTKSGSYTVTHNGDGSKSVSVQIRINSGSDPQRGGVYYNAATGGAQTLTLTTIPRTSNVSLNTSTIECNGSNRFTIYTNRKSNSFTHTITYGFGSASGTIATGVGASTTWTPSIDLLRQIPNASAGWGTITCVTYNGSTRIGQSTVNFTLTAGAAASPTMSGGSLTEQVSSIINNAGSNVTLQALSRKYVQCNVGTRYGASVASVTVSNGNVNVGLTNQGSGRYAGYISGVSSGTYVLRITDTRGLTASQTITQTYYEYAVPTISNASLARDSETGSTGKFSANGKFSPILDNNVTISLKLSWIEVTQQFTRGGTSGTWSVTQGYDDVYYTNSYSATITVSDKFTSSNPLTVRLGPSVPTFAIGRTDVYFGGDPASNFYRARNRYLGDGVNLNELRSSGYYIQNTDAGAQNGANYPTPYAGVLNVYWSSSFVFQQYQSYFDDTLWLRRWYDWQKNWSQWKLANINAIYPVGSIYMSVNSTSPATLFGGTWQRIEERFLLGASATYGAGSTGGEASHILSLAEMPVHSHPLGPGVQFVGSGEPRTWNIDSSTQQNYAAYGTTAGAGGNASHNNMPPYLSVYIWKRTA